MHTPLTAPASDRRSPPQHQYGTRIRQSSLIKPSTRIRQSPDPPSVSKSRAKPTPSQHSTTQHIQPSNYPEFPLPGVVLHPEDANSKVFLAIGRAFLSVDNRAMTIKDLAEMTANFGLVCQNASAAGQAITTYIRNHHQRCDDQHDQPLLLRHTLSGTSDDDDLLPALHSRSGGAPFTFKSDKRATNFRKGTVVWYLSRATGAPCPFARANIRLCDYTEDGKVVPDPSSAVKREGVRPRKPAACGQKRKRPLRSCNKADNDSGDDNSDYSAEVQPPPPKVKLTLRLKPLLVKASIESSQSRDIIDISQPSSESEDGDMSVASEDSDDAPAQHTQEEEWLLPPYPRRSISIPAYTPIFDSGSPFCVASQSQRRSPSLPASIHSPPPDSDDEDMVSLLGSDESDGDADTWESPGPRSPSAPFVPSPADVTVKREPTDVQGMLDAWEDNYDYVPRERMAFSAAEELDKIKVEALDNWDDWSCFPGTAKSLLSPARDSSPAPVFVKQEETEASLLSPLRGPSCPMADFNTWRQSNDCRASPQYDSFYARTRCMPPAEFTCTNPPLSISVPSTSESTSTLSFMLNALSMQSTTNGLSGPLSPLTPLSEISPEDDSIIVHTSQPCSPAISVTKVEGISVYQMVLGNTRLLRRIDTDFVNITPIASHIGGSTASLKNVAQAIVVSEGLPCLVGMWVPLSAARCLMQESPISGGTFHIFLSDNLFERFPQAVQDFHLSSACERSQDGFGTPFSTTKHQEAAFSSPLVANFSITLLDSHAAPESSEIFSEEDLFSQFCCIPDGEGKATIIVTEVENSDPGPCTDAEPSTPARVLRRSKRVADALASRTRPRTRRRSGRNSVS